MVALELPRQLFVLRMVPTKYKGKDHAEKVDLYKGYWNPQRKIGVATNIFEIISPESEQKC